MRWCGRAEGLKALITRVPAITGRGSCPSVNGKLFSSLRCSGMLCLWPAMLMTLDWYQEPATAFLPAMSC